ncbi:hypothetical protein [Vacuolonema iberomarrocanum]|uniref:hypothetical protein n=1 Tax=Vacuolonema iberomarrocanum TaxID=3454632 RepID=UPI001A0EE094|nr:hypothetical protein [filamentous cyanobacterium LEGE 07170]
MATEQPNLAAFPDNWAYLKTELAWLDRVLMVAVSRQRKEVKGVDRIAQTAADRVSSHWWQGVVSLEGKIAYDEHRPQKAEGAVQQGRYQQQLESKIRASMEQGIFLALPTLSDRLQMPLFEKNLVLMALAPEVNRRYGGIYQFLQGDEKTASGDLPTADLALRLFCRNDREWCVARQHLFSQSVLYQRGLLEVLPRENSTSLNRRVRLAPRLLNFLLADAPTREGLDALLRDPIAPLPLKASPKEDAQSVPGLLRRFPSTPWEELILPEALMQQLQALTQEASDSTETVTKGMTVLFAGASGTGKTLAAEAIAHTREQSLVVADLAQMQPEHFPQVWQRLTVKAAPVVLIRGAEQWLRRSATIVPGALQRWLAGRQANGGLTILTVTHEEAVAVRWRPYWTMACLFPVPVVGDRQHLWGQSFADDIPLDKAIDWGAVARCAPLTGGEIRAIAKAAIYDWRKSGEPNLTLNHLNRALQAAPANAIRRIPLLKPRKRAARKRKTSRKQTSS